MVYLAIIALLGGHCLRNDRIGRERDRILDYFE